jgi:hypothetical protein
LPNARLLGRVGLDPSSPRSRRSAPTRSAPRWCTPCAWHLRVVRDRDAVLKLFEEIGPRFLARHGGYTRIMKIAPRPGDAAPMALLELIPDETSKAESKPAPKGKETKEAGESKAKGKTKEAAPAAEPKAKSKAKGRSGAQGEEGMQGRTWAGQVGCHHEAIRPQPRRRNRPSGHLDPRCEIVGAIHRTTD